MPVAEHGGSCGIFTIDGPLPAYDWQPSMTYDPVRGRVWTITDGIFRSVVIEGDEGLIAFDTFWSPGSALSYKQTIDRLFPRKRVHTVIYTHDHLDHTGYGAYFVPDEATIIAHELTDEVICARHSEGQLPATETWSGERRMMSIDGAEFELIYPGPTHGTGNTAVHFGNERLLFMVDTVIVGAHYNVVTDFHWTSWIPNCRRLLGLDWDVYVPGHFWQLDRKGFADDLDLWDATAHAAQVALVKGIDPNDWPAVKKFTYNELDPTMGDTVFRFDEFMAINVARHMLHYQTGGWGLPDALSTNVEPIRSQT